MMLKINNMKKIIIINGPSCAGKSTIIDKIFETKQDIFWLKFDSVKRFFVDYIPSVDKQKVTDLVVVIGKDRMEKDEDILCENHIQEVIDFAKEKSYSIYEYNIEAPYETLLERFRARLLNIKEGLKINTSEEKHRETYDKYLVRKDMNVKTFDTSLQSAEEIAKEILSDIL